jgi:hypothetical protein
MRATDLSALAKNQKRRVMLTNNEVKGSEKNTRTLFALAIERWDPKLGWAPDGFVFTHAEHRGKAILAYMASKEKYKTRIAWCGPAIGFHVKDNHGDKLIA